MRASPVEVFLTSSSGPIQVTCGGGFPSALQRSVSSLKMRVIRSTVAATEMKRINDTNPRTQRRLTLNVDYKVLQILTQVVLCYALIGSALISFDLGDSAVEISRF